MVKKVGLDKNLSKYWIFLCGLLVGYFIFPLSHWDWKESLIEIGLRNKWCNFEWVCPSNQIVQYAPTNDTLLLGNDVIIRLANIQVTNPTTNEYLNLMLEDEFVNIKYNKVQDDPDGNLLGEVWKENESISINELLINEGYAKRIDYDK